jgi:hypothetical protein
MKCQATPAGVRSGDRKLHLSVPVTSGINQRAKQENETLELCRPHR